MGGGGLFFYLVDVKNDWGSLAFLYLDCNGKHTMHRHTAKDAFFLQGCTMVSYLMYSLQGIPV